MIVAPNATASSPASASARDVSRRSSRRAPSLSLTAMLLGALGCAAPRPSPEAPEAAPSSPSTPFRCILPETPHATLRASDAPAGFPSEKCVARAKELVGKMTLEEKLGQMMQPDRGTVREG